MRTFRAPVAASFAAAAVLALTACSGGGSGDAPAATDEPGTGASADAPLYDQLPSSIRDAGVITVAADTHPPYRTIEEGGEITGIDPDLQAALSEQLGVPFQMQTSSGLDAMLTGMLSGRFDAFNGPVRTTPEREAEFDAVVWMTTRTSYVFLAERADELDDPEALCGARVAGVTGSVTESQLERYNEWCEGEGLDPAEFVGLEDTNSTFLAVNSDRADYAGTTQSAAIDLQASDPDQYGYLIQTDEQGAGVDQLAMFMPKDSGLAEPMLAAFQAIFDNGEYDRIMSEWGIEDAAVEEPSLNPMTGQ
ncbi:transporter substrate-binding domain-containing protein [Microbacterium sp. ET2]|uniref:transporter substrate-binding domain-containing protein n=1 Tax=Microbacterium albipurpureum TaxID=3050384 RepID=UPI00259D1E8A|nr:transporter substrate-binding domain-containing protein [Microbacterium sp. ET2 (Ac-2212)]WJL94405.1 transporter substrate-binding domain-containing protein [Microbacterium sp. ET2 (Ac-2212)]